MHQSPTKRTTPNVHARKHRSSPALQTHPSPTKVSSPRRIAYQGLFALLAGAFLSLFVCGLLQSCSPPQSCQERINTSRLNTNGSDCQRDCDCNNYNYEGFCINGRCVAAAREDCSTKGNKRICIPRRVLPGQCAQGYQTCYPPYLDGAKWGDCEPLSPKPENDKAGCRDGVDNDCDGKIDQFDEGCAAFCVPGTKEPCYTGTKNTENVGTCKAGTRTCNTDQVWGPCQNEVNPRAEGEICGDKLDNDCDGQIDNGCTLHRPCFSEANCNQGEICVQTAPSAGFCFQECDPTKDGDALCAKNTDDQRTACMPFFASLAGTTHICAVPVPAQGFCDLNRSILCKGASVCYRNRCYAYAREGQTCDVRTSIDKIRPCAPGLECLPFAVDRPARCYKTCKESSDCARPSFACIQYSPFLSVCVQLGCSACSTKSNCTFDRDNAPDKDKDSYLPHECIATTQITYCAPTPLTGPVKAGMPCNRNDPTKRCEANLQCLSSSGNIGICTAYCSVTNNHADCTKHHPRMRCGRLSTCINRGLCLYPCLASKDCPKGTLCDTTSGACLVTSCTTDANCREGSCQSGICSL